MKNVFSTPPQSTFYLDPFELVPYLSQFTAEMMSTGYTALTTKAYTDAIRHFGTWLQHNSIRVSGVMHRTVKEFSSHHCTCPGGRRYNSVSKKYARRVSRFVDYLHQIHVIDLDTTPITKLKIQWDQDGFFRWLRNDRGLVDITIKNYVRALDLIFPNLGYDSHQYSAKRIRTVVLNYAEHNGSCNTQRKWSFESALPERQSPARLGPSFNWRYGACQPNASITIKANGSSWSSNRRTAG